MVIMSGGEAYPFYSGAGPELLRMASDLRKNMTPAEKMLWERLRNRQLMGYRFRRQHPIFEFVVDFFCYEAMLVVEVDGDVHDNSFQAERDAERAKILNSFGIKELRFRNEDVRQKIGSVLNKIENELRQSP
jgi:very-short-patch-repair endonuclease